MGGEQGCIWRTVLKTPEKRGRGCSAERMTLETVQLGGNRRWYGTCRGEPEPRECVVGSSVRMSCGFIRDRRDRRGELMGRWVRGSHRRMQMRGGEAETSPRISVTQGDELMIQH